MADRLAPSQGASGACDELWPGVVACPRRHHHVLVDDLLPPVLRLSKLPWKPDHDDQTPVVRDDDSWHALVGTLEWSLVAHRDAPEHPLCFLLALRDIVRDEDCQLMLKTLPSLETASAHAEGAHDLMLEQLLLDLKPKISPAP